MEWSAASTSVGTPQHTNINYMYLQLVLSMFVYLHGILYYLN